MSVPKGGRGRKVPYKTTHVRVPEPIKSQVHQLGVNYRQRFMGGNQLELIPSPLDQYEAAKIAEQILNEKLSTKESVLKLLAAIYRIDVVL